MINLKYDEIPETLKPTAKAVEKLAMLFEAPYPGASTWWMFVADNMKIIVQKAKEAGIEV